MDLDGARPTSILIVETFLAGIHLRPRATAVLLRPPPLSGFMKPLGPSVRLFELEGETDETSMLTCQYSITGRRQIRRDASRESLS